MIDKETLALATDTLRNAREVFIAAHVQPDGDCIGSQLALAWALRELGRKVTMALDDRIPETYSFLQGYREIARREPGAEDVFVYVDGSDPARYGKSYDREKIGTRPVINVDHHATNEPFANINLVDSKAASTAEIINELIQSLDAPITPEIAQALLTGIVTDTLGFRTAATTPETLEKATQLLREGGSIPEIIDRVYNRRSFNSLRLLGRVIGDMKMDGPVIWSEVSQQELRELGVNGNGTSGIVNNLLTVADARVAFLLVEKDDGRIDLGIRSRADVDISGVAKRLGGGGHKQAAGATLPPPMATAAERVLKQVKEELNLPRVATVKNGDGNIAH